jgi:outer membrane protein assembly factor BamB
VIVGLAGALAVLVWWLFFSRAAWSERLGAVALMVVALVATWRVVHVSIATGMMGLMVPVVGTPFLSLVLVVWATASRGFSTVTRWATLVGAMVLACGGLALLRTGGITGGGASDLHWRWTKTPEERLLSGVSDEPAPLLTTPQASASEPHLSAPASDRPTARSGETTPPLEAPANARTGDEPAFPPTLPTTATTALWPGFRGPDRDSVVHGVRIKTDWTASPPVALWRRPIGPGWSSFAVGGDLLYTQEQRGDDEVVACYRLTTGAAVWRHRDPVRFWESNGGAGPRATPTLSSGRVYAFGATGMLNALDAATGAAVWSRNVASDSDTKVPMWGFASSPLVVDDLVIVAAAGTLVAYDRSTGQRRWIGPAHGGSYSSPHRSTIDGVPQILLLSEAGLTSVAPADGTLLWEHSWPGVTIVQPALTPDGVLVNTVATTGGLGTRRLAVAHGPGGWHVEERWTSTALKPYFNDFVVHKGHAYGFDGSILACIDLEDGTRTWKGGRYGNGQLVLIPDQEVLLILSEDGELALVGASPDQFMELARFPAIEGKTWNHPVLVGDILLVRNGQEMAAFRLTLTGS